MEGLSRDPGSVSTTNGRGLLGLYRCRTLYGLPVSWIAGIRLHTAEMWTGP
jgi:hypothetical protein